MFLRTYSRKIIQAVALSLLAGAAFAQQAPFSPSAIRTDCNRWVDSVMSKMTVQAKVGQLIVPMLPARADSETKRQVKELAKKYQIGGLLFSDGTVEEQVLLTNMAQKMAKVPLMITFDGEWGLSMRLKGMPDFPRNAALGCIEDLQLIEAYGQEVAKEMRQIGVNVNFAPVADVNTNPLNPVINERSFGESAQQVADRVLAYSRGLERGGVLAVSKHFPGHGDSRKDSHFALPELDHNRARLDSVELLPFRRLIEAGCGGMMVGHLKVPALDETGTPSSLSQPIVDKLLRQELGFQGLLFTDALDMQGVKGEPQRYVKALLAGNDVLLVQRATQEAVGELMQAVGEGKLSQELIDARCRKVLAYKYLMGLRNRPAPIATNGLAQRLCSQEANELAARLRRESVTVLTNHFNLFPLPTDKGKIAVLGFGAAGADSAFVAALSAEREVAHLQIPRGADEAAQAEVLRQLASYNRVLVCVTGDHLIREADAAFLASLRLKAPVGYLLFTSYRTMQQIKPALSQATAVVLAHAADADLQHYVARLTVGKEGANGCFSMSLAPLYAQGTSCRLTPGTQPTTFFPNDFGLQAHILQGMDSLARVGLAAGAYPGCRLLVLKDGTPIIDRGYGVH